MKYLKIFLGLVLCLCVTKKSMSQHCMTFEYDRNGNRIECTYIENCSEEKDQMISSEIEDDSEVLLSVYPNPTNGIIKVSLAEECSENPISYSILDVNGITCQLGCVTTNEFEINMVGYSPGVYMFVLSVADKTHAKTIVKL